MAAGTTKRLPKTITIYLVIYNAVLCLGWIGVLLLGLLHISRHGSFIGLFESVSIPLYIFQTAATMEVAHCAVGFVRSSVFLTGFQVASRLFFVWGVVYSVPQVQESIGVTATLFAWTVTEIIRYVFYVCTLVSVLPHALLWCRYTFFIFLYPIGVTGELTTIYAALPIVKKTGLYSWSLPNPFNFGVSFYLVLIVAMLTYLPVFPQLYIHMLAQRRKALSGDSHKKKE